MNQGTNWKFRLLHSAIWKKNCLSLQWYNILLLYLHYERKNASSTPHSFKNHFRLNWPKVMWYSCSEAFLYLHGCRCLRAPGGFPYGAHVSENVGPMWVPHGLATWVIILSVSHYLSLPLSTSFLHFCASRLKVIQSFEKFWKLGG